MKLITKIKQHITNYIDAQLDKLVAAEIASRLDDIDLDREVAKTIQEINWSDHIDYSSLSYHIDIDHHELGKHIDIDTSDLADALTERLQFRVSTR